MSQADNHQSKQTARRRCVIKNISFFLILTAVAFAANILFYQQYVEFESKSLEADIAFHLETVRTLCEYELLESITDLRILANLQHVSQISNRHKEFNRSAIETVTQHFISSLTFKQNIDQIRLIDKSGKELIRVDRRNGSPEKVPDHLLQNKSDRKYFHEAIDLSDQAIYISPLDLNIEQGKLEIPYKPVIRFAVKVKQQEGDDLLLVINFLGNTFLDKIRTLKFEESRINVTGYLINAEGHFLVGGSPNIEWGHVLPSRQDETMTKHFPDTWQTLSTTKQGVISTPKGHFNYDTIDLNSYASEANFNDNFWKIVVHVPPNSLTKSKMFIGAVTGSLTLFFIVTVLGYVILQIRSTYRRIDTLDTLEKMATTDYLTGIFNRRQFFSLGELEFQRSRRYQSKLALLTFDVDHFKKVNDTYGHPAGDSVLVQICDLMNHQLRATDIFGRIGGEEFAILLIESEEKETQMVADRLRRIIAEHNFVIGNNRKITVTISVGGAIACPDDSFTSLFKNSDTALYQAKNSGRNRTIFNNLDCTHKISDET